MTLRVTTINVYLDIALILGEQHDFISNTGLAYRRVQTQCHLEGPSRIALNPRFLEINNIMMWAEKCIAFEMTQPI